MHIRGVTLTELDQHGDIFAALVTSEIRKTLGQVADGLNRAISLDDLTVIRTIWAQRVEDQLISHVNGIYWQAVNAIADPVTRHLMGLRAAGLRAEEPPELDPGPEVESPFRIPRVTNSLAEDYLANATNRLVNVGNDVWEIARQQLLDGMHAGDGVRDLAARVTDSTALATPRAEVIARTEVNGASNAGALDQVRALAVPGEKGWISTRDIRTRASHIDADGQSVALDEMFDVGGEAMDRPHDPAASAGNTVNCRCTIEFNLPDDQLADMPQYDDEGDLIASGLTAAAGDEQTGAMIALVPSDADIKRLAIEGGEPVEELHLTLLYLGDAVNWDPSDRQAVIDAVEAGNFTGIGDFTSNAFGAAIWNPDSATPALVLNIGDGPETLDWLHETHKAAERAVDPYELKMPQQHTPWAAHICLAYSMDPALFEQALTRLGPVTFDKIRVAFAAEATDISLTAATLQATAGR